MAGPGRLTALQGRILELLSRLEPPFTLVGGGALVGFHLAHRVTRDLDLFWRGRTALDAEPETVVARLDEADLDVAVLQRSPTFVRLRVADAQETVIVDLVADPAPGVAADEEHRLGDVSIRVAAVHDVLVTKLCALLGRAELRDLVDVQALLSAGADLKLGIEDAPRIDTGFSALTLATSLGLARSRRPASR